MLGANLESANGKCQSAAAAAAVAVAATVTAAVAAAATVTAAFEKKTRTPCQNSTYNDEERYSQS